MRPQSRVMAANERLNLVLVGLMASASAMAHVLMAVLAFSLYLVILINLIEFN